MATSRYLHSNSNGGGSIDTVIGGKIESPEQAAKRELKEETGIILDPIASFKTSQQNYSVFLTDKNPTRLSIEFDRYEWINWEDVHNYPQAIPDWEELSPLLDTILLENSMSSTSLEEKKEDTDVS
eukprot:TRINITY_DN5234_c0_g1_i2.p2 TRINITY_DN5234_c0_g1~~TRINITY_DN5234_c0_g1_i2.p2  ORF type:complete len:126 (-),score=32.34 TRINITY_DN5234_c0_g1_i2:41-418(-)